jgi:hypothetical protein
MMFPTLTDLGPYALTALAVVSAYLVLMGVVCASRMILYALIVRDRGEQRGAEG